MKEERPTFIIQVGRAETHINSARLGRILAIRTKITSLQQPAMQMWKPRRPHHHSRWWRGTMMLPVSKYHNGCPGHRIRYAPPPTPTLPTPTPPTPLPPPLLPPFYCYNLTLLCI
ncbi:hypothetical protein V1478_004163 [Vespula squamosa]|uniref:Uncharacterized protein n=1 Tax=Vespula squamosa TaxID=30214 RepID=A0ABD2BNV6_VESSQ